MPDRQRKMMTSTPQGTPISAQNPAAVDLQTLGAIVLLTFLSVALLFIVVKIIIDLRSYRYR